MSKPQGKCIYCDGTPLSKEHVYADWLRDYIPRVQNHHTVEITTSRQHRDEVSRSRRTGDPHSRRIRCVCVDCNTGWMSRLQEDVRPYLVPLLSGEPIRLRRRGQSTLAAWAAMTAMTGEFLNKSSIAVQARDRKWLRDNQLPPSHWRIWIGRHQRKTHPLWSHNSVRLTKEGGVDPWQSSDAPPNLQATTMCLGRHLAVHILSSHIARHLIRRCRFAPDVTHGLLQIWPAARLEIAWPPPLILDDSAIRYIADQVHTNALAVARKIEAQRASGVLSRPA